MEMLLSFISLDEQRRIVAYLDSVQARLASHKGMISLAGVTVRYGGGVVRAVTVRAG